jgi:magnesium transporter
MTDIAGHPVAETPPEDQVRDEEGRLRDEFVERVSAAIQAGDAEQVRALAGDLHEADMGALIEALDADDRPRLIELLGDDFDFSALTEVDDSVREEILEEISNEESSKATMPSPSSRTSIRKTAPKSWRRCR